jgi:NAD(P)H-nitrite reductase large subunit
MELRNMKPYTQNVMAAPTDEIICWCSAVTKETILKAKQNGAQDMDDIRQTTGACTVGRCKELSPRGRCCSIEIKQLLAAEITCNKED